MAASSMFGLLLLLGISFLPLYVCQLPRTTKLCTYFGGGRMPKEAYSLPNCTWYKENACCERTEVTSVFSEMPALLTNEKGCYHRMNYLMCYFCSPEQHKWFNQSVSVCKSYCDELFEHCKSAEHDGISIGSKYKSGVEFCKAQKFKVVHKGSESCFDFDSSLFGAGLNVRPFVWLILTAVIACLGTHSFGSG